MRLAESRSGRHYRAKYSGWDAWSLVFAVLAAGMSKPILAQPINVDADRAMDRAAEEYVARTMPMNNVRRVRARSGQVRPPCQMNYPDIGETPSPDFANRMYHAINYVVTKQNMIAAGVPASKAVDIANAYRREQLKYEALPDSKQSALEKNRASPRWWLSYYLNDLDIPGLPHFADPETCDILPAWVTLASPYRFELIPNSGRIWIIPSFSFRYCQLRFSNPYSRSQCTEWEEVIEGQKRTFLGNYFYSAEWTGSSPRRGPLRLTYGGAGVQKIVVRRPSH